MSAHCDSDHAWLESIAYTVLLQGSIASDSFPCGCSVTKFQGVHALNMYFPETLGADHTEIFFVGIKGEHVQVRSYSFLLIMPSSDVLATAKLPDESLPSFHCSLAGTFPHVAATLFDRMQPHSDIWLFRVVSSALAPDADARHACRGSGRR